MKTQESEGIQGRGSIIQKIQKILVFAGRVLSLNPQKNSSSNFVLTAVREGGAALLDLKSEIESGKEDSTVNHSNLCIFDKVIPSSASIDNFGVRIKNLGKETQTYSERSATLARGLTNKNSNNQSAISSDKNLEICVTILHIQSGDDLKHVTDIVTFAGSDLLTSSDPATDLNFGEGLEMVKSFMNFWKKVKEIAFVFIKIT